ncbi:MAG: phospholipase [Bacteroides sp.]|nr:phospholipase [Bacteroides sp.]
MILALYILLAIVAAGVVLKLTDRRPRKPDDEPATADTAGGDDNGECCGMHITCERDSLLASVSPQVEYFDDEELDAYRGRRADAYSDTEIEQFRDILLTLQPDDIAPWARSVQLRGIELPAPVREELLFIVSEARATRAAGHA